MNFLNNLFGTITGGLPYSTHVDFIPANDKGDTIDVSGKTEGPLWIGLKSPEAQRRAYESCFALASVIDSLAECDIAGTIEILRSKGKGAEDYATSDWAKRMTKLLEQPNPLQSWAQFRGQQIVYKKIFGYCPVLPIVPTGFTSDYALAMINIPPWLFDVESTGKILMQTKKEQIVAKYKINILGSIKEFKPDDIFILEDSFMQDEEKDFLLPKSRMVGLDMAISNLCAAMEADNVLLRKKGPLGFISHDAAATKDSVAGYLPMTKREKSELQRALNGYGLSLAQFQYVISRTAAKWNPMSFNVAELGTKQTIEASERAICHRYRYPYVLYEESGSTYANANVAYRFLYESNIIPNNTKDLQHYNKFFKAEENNVKIVSDYESVSALQEDKLNAAQAANTMDSALSIEFNNNIITLNEWRRARGYDIIEGGDVYKKDLVQNTDTNGEEGNSL